MRIPLPNLKSNMSKDTSEFFTHFKKSIRFTFIFFVSLAITFSNYAQEDDSDFLDKVLEEKTKKSDGKKVANQTQPVQLGLKDKKKKAGKNGKKTSKTAAKFDPNRRPTRPGIPITNPAEAANPNNPSSQQLNNNKLNLEYWMHEELTMNPENVPGLVPPSTQNNSNPSNTVSNNTTEKPIEKKNPDKPIEKEKETKPNAFITFLNEYKKIIFIFAAIIIFAIYRLRYVGPRDYNNSGRIFSKFRNK
jgi:Sec region non-globular protein